MSEARHIYDIGIVGNCAYVAHVDARARVVWMCLPRFDSSCVFGHLLDRERGGEFSIASDEERVQSARQEYVWNTNVLVTTIETADGAFRVTDCAPRFRQFGRSFKPLMLVRKVEPIAGTPRVRIVCRPRGDYGRVLPNTYIQSNHLRYDLDGEIVRLNTNVPLSYIAGERSFVLSEKKYLILTWGAPLERALEDTAEEYVRRTVQYWQKWVERCAIGRFYQQEVIRSALVLKLHQFEDTGAIIASATTSLPEHPESGRNWDYRYCWLRDAHFTLTALNRIGQFEEMKRFAQFIENIAASATQSRYPPVVRIDGDFELPEAIVPMKGYDGSNTVRIGNAAATQVQNDSYGQIIYALLMLYVDERFPSEPRSASKRLIATLLGIIESCLDQPDASLWEFRELTRRHCYTSLCHWVGAKSAQKIARALDDREMRRAATRLTARSERLIEACYDASVGAYMQEPGSKYVDASALQLIILNYLDTRSERAARHLVALEERLMAGGGLLHRYTHADDFGAPASAFLVCSFWYVEALAAMGRIEDALRELDILLRYSNGLGLFSEDVDPKTGGQWGNFPQTYSHVGLINAVLRITSKIDYPEFY
ncbi:Glucoamylase [Labilithrix luteola]|uniref:Glucoamylase n=1 Tax=Labilithrix luteola TaxID=1391654 RepID=A0A0K1Q0G4_9BACT|nr:glycoside hydrolase family 15 protein [Labilithrix luteola]AKU99136.1 Glucoamylase [Labilithrix luteola]